MLRNLTGLEKYINWNIVSLALEILYYENHFKDT